MQDYMQSMASTLNGTNAPAHPHIDPKLVRVYRNNSVSAFADVLRANFMSVEALVGREYFSALALKFIENYPYQKRTLIGYGSGFAKTLEDHKLPYLSSFARLDRAWTQAHIATDTTSLELESFVKSLGPDGDLLGQSLSPKPDVQVITNQWPVYNIWAKLRDSQELGESIEMEPMEEHVLLWRLDNEVIHKTLSEREFTFINAVFKQNTLGQASALAQEITPELDINTMLIGMMNAGIFMAPTGDQHD